MDADADGISDDLEGMGDPDADSLANSVDPDSDGDGILDRIEGRVTLQGTVCAPADTDGDGLFDFLDTDSDSDGLDDARELELGSDPLRTDSDLDGVPDLVEVEGSRTDPTDAASNIDLDRNFFVVLPFGTDPELRTLRFSTVIRQLDVFFLIDTTSTMAGERTSLIDGLLEVVVPGVRELVSDVHFGVGAYDDYPVHPHGADEDSPFYLLREVAPANEDTGSWSLSSSRTECPSDARGSDIGGFIPGANGTPDLLEAVLGLPCHDGADTAESIIPALYATATGDGLSWPGGSVPAQRCSNGGHGYPCFRDGVLPLIVLIGDSLSHNARGGARGYGFSAPSYDQALAALGGLEARVLGIHSGIDSADFVNIARDSGAVRGDGSPIVFPVSGSGNGLNLATVEAVSDFAVEADIDVATRLESVSGNPGNVDARGFITGVGAVEGYQNGVPGTGFDSMGADAFFGVNPGTEVEFELRFENLVRDADEVEVHRARIIVVGDGITDLDERQVFILVPPRNRQILI